MIMQQTHDVIPHVFVRLTNQLKTVEPLEATFKYARAQKREDTPTAMLKSMFVSVDLELEREDQKGGE
jgi:hypothetical protein